MRLPDPAAFALGWLLIVSAAVAVLLGAAALVTALGGWAIVVVIAAALAYARARHLHERWRA